MSHVSEGMLHAYLDGALDEVAGSEARAIRDHVAVCGPCRDRLDEAKTVRDQATAILEGALPTVELPPLEELRARAEATSGPQPAARPLGLYRLGWAASVVLALGTGWLLRGQPELVDGVQLPVAPLVETNAASDRRANEADQVAATPAEGTDYLAEAPAAPVGFASNTAKASEAAPATDADRDVLEGLARSRSGTLLAQAEPALRDEVAADASLRGGLRAIEESAGPVTFATERRVDAPVAAAAAPADSVSRSTDPPLTEPLALEQIVVTGRPLVAVNAATDSLERPAREEREAQAAGERRERFVVTSALDVSALTRLGRDEDDEDRKGGDELGSQIVPGLEVMFTEFVDEVPGVTRFLQALGSGETLEIVHVPQGVDPESLPPFAADGKTGVIAPRAGGWVILRASRSVDELKILLDRLNGIS